MKIHNCQRNWAKLPKNISEWGWFLYDITSFLIQIILIRSKRSNKNHNDSHNYEKEQMKSKSLEGKVEELEGIIDLMKEIVFNDTNDGSK